MLDLKINYISHEFEGFEPVNEDGVKLIIIDYKISNLDEEQLEFKFSIQTGTKKGYYIYDFIHMYPYKSTSWKLPKLLDSVGRNIDGLLRFNDLVGLSLTCDLRRTERSGKSYQNILYRPFGTKPVVKKQHHEDSPFW